MALASIWREPVIAGWAQDAALTARIARRRRPRSSCPASGGQVRPRAVTAELPVRTLS